MAERYFRDRRGQVIPVRFCADLAEVGEILNPPIRVSDDVAVVPVEVGEDFVRWEIRTDSDLVGDDLANED